MHVRARDPADAVVGHPKPGDDIEMRKRPLPGVSTVGVSSHQLVNLYLRVWFGWCARKTLGFILVWAECPYIQFGTARVTDTWFVVGVTNGREREEVPSLWRNKQACSAKACRDVLAVLRRITLCSDMSFMGRPASPFIGKGEEQVYKGRRRKTKEKKASRTAGSFFSFMRVLPML